MNKIWIYVNLNKIYLTYVFHNRLRGHFLHFHAICLNLIILVPTLHSTRRKHSSLYYSLVASSDDTKFLFVDCSSPTSIVGYYRTQQHRRPTHIRFNFLHLSLTVPALNFPYPDLSWNRNYVLVKIEISICLQILANFRCISIATVFVQLHCLDFPFPLISVIEIICVCFLLSLQWCICSFSA